MSYQTQTLPPSFQPIIVVKNPPEPKERKRERQAPAIISQYRATVVVEGALYRVSLEMILQNNLARPRELECEVLVPLPPGAMIDGYALDIDGALVDAVAVTKEKARVALESEERKKVDPGIAEHVQGNLFRTRVYPLLEKRTVRIDYVAPLERMPQNAGLLCTVGMIFDEPVDDFQFEILVKDLPDQKGARLAEFFQTPRAVDEWQEMGFARSDERGGWLASLQRKNFQPQKNARVILPESPILEAQFERTAQGVFLLAPILAPKRSEDQTRNPTPTVDELTILWDASASRAGVSAPNSRESVFLKAAIKRFQCKRVRFIPVRDDVDESEIVVLNANASDDYLVHELLDLIETITYDGATNLNAALPYATRDATTFLFSDGLNNWGEQLDYPPATGRLFACASGDKVDAPTLKRLTNPSGGAYFNLDVTAPDDLCDQIAQILLGKLQRVRITTRNLELADDVAELATGTSYQLIAAKVRDENQPIALECYQGDVRFAELNYASDAWKTLNETPRRNANLQSYFAQMKLNSLLPSQATQREAIEKLGLLFGLATPATSLIVLEDLEQYLKYRICPPESLSEMRKEYLAHERTEYENRELKRVQRMEHVKMSWRKRLEWYRTEFKPVPTKAVSEQVELDAETRTTRLSRTVHARARFASDEFSESGVECLEDEVIADVEEGLLCSEQMEEVCYDMAVRCDCVNVVSDVLGSPSRSSADEEENLKAKTQAATIRLASWNPDCDVIGRLAKLPGAEQEGAYLKARKEYGESPTFYFACAEFFQRQGNKQLAVRILSNISESSWDDQQLLRPLAKKLLALNEIEFAISIFRRVLDYRPEEPQSYRDLALALEERADKLVKAGKQDQAIQEYRKALDLLTTVINGRDFNDWDARFPEIEVVAIEDACGIIAKLKRLNVANLSYDVELFAPFEIDMRITLTWSADNTDFDLWVFEPDGTKVYYGARMSRNGGLLSCDYRDGYGPEEYLIRKARPGKYRIDADYFSSTALDVLGEIYLEAEVITNFGRPNQERSRLGFALRDVKENCLIGEVEY